MSGIGKTGMNQDRDSISIWRVALPFDLDRETYIKNCFLTGTITLANETGERVSNVKVGKFAMQQIDFPLTTKTLGSEVACLTAPYSGDLYVAEVYYTSSQYAYQQENQYRLYKTNGIGVAGVSIDGNGNIAITVDGDSDSGIVNINVTNQDRKGKLKINVNGDLMIQNDGTTWIETTNNIHLQHKDGDDDPTYIDIKKDQVKIQSKKILLNEGDEPILLGKKTVQFISDLLDQLGKESAGPYPLLGNSQYVTMKEKLEDLKSTLSFLK